MEEQSPIVVVLLVVAILVGVYLIRDGNLNQPAPGFSLPEDYGGRVDLASYRGRPVLLVFWMASCGICRHELPVLNRLAPEFQSAGIAIVAIHLGGVDDARNYMRSNRIDVTSLIDSEGTTGQSYHVSGVPKLVLVGKDGKVKRTASGWTDESVLREWLDAFKGS